MAEQRRSRSSEEASGGDSPAKSTAARARSKRSQKRRSKSPTRGTAPSAPDTTRLQLIQPSKAAREHVPSDVDAMGKDKRREVIGHSYGPSRRSQLMFFGIVAAVIVVIVGGGQLLVSKVDVFPKTVQSKAPWGQADAPQTPPANPANF